MPEKPDRVLIQGSTRAALPGARLIGPVPDNERFRITLRLRPKNPLEQPTRRTLPR